MKLTIPRAAFAKKKLWLIISLCAIVVTLGSYAAYSVISWRSYGQHYQVMQATTKHELDSAVALPVKSVKERQQKLAKLKAVSLSVNKAQTTCQPNALTDWQGTISSVKASQVACQKTIDKLSSFTKSLDTLIAYLDSDNEMAALLASIPTQPAQPDEKTWDQVATAWQQLDTKVASMQTDTSFAPTKEVIAKAVKGINSAWQELLAAHGAKGKARFVKARTDLTTAYVGLAAINDENDKQLTDLTAKLSSAYKLAF